MTSPRYDWWQVQALHPDKKDPFDLFIGSFPSEAKAREKMEELKAQGYEHINLIEPDHVKRRRNLER